MNMNISVPKSVAEAIDQLATCLGPTEVAGIKAGRISYHDYHFGMGMYIRNEWGFWVKEGPLYEELEALGLHHPDDMSGLILKGMVQKVLGQELDIQSEVQKYKDYWDSEGHHV